MDFSDWITEKYLEWRGTRIGHSSSIAEFAKVFGASQQLVTDWMKKPNGKTPRSNKYVSALVKVYGEEVYDVLGLPRPGGNNFRTRLEEALREALTVMIEKGIQPGSPEGDKIIAEIADKYGFEAKRTSDE